MSRSILVAALILGGVILTQPAAKANPPGCANLGCGGFCFKMFGHIHQHGPLVNYGPYSGYYPFEPYGPWNSQLQYTGPGRNDYACGSLFGGGKCGWLGSGHGGLGGKCAGCGAGLGSRLHGGGSSCNNCAWGNYANVTFGNVRSRLNLGSRFGGCEGCGDAPTISVPSCPGCVSTADDTVGLESNPVITTAFPAK